MISANIYTHTYIYSIEAKQVFKNVYTGIYFFIFYT